MRTNRVIQIPIRPTKKSCDARKEAARLWNNMVRLHKFIRRRGAMNPGIWLWSGCGDFQKHYKGRYDLHSQTVQAIIQKFFAAIATIRKLRRNGNNKARYPYKSKPFVNPIFKGQSVRIFGNRIRVPLGNRRYLWFTIPDVDGRIVQVELGYDKLYLTIQKEIRVTVRTSGKGIRLVRTSEAYTSQTCPICGNRKKISGRVCKCGFCAPRDAVGAHNIRNLYINNSIVPNFSVPSKSLKYLRPIRMKTCGRSSKLMDDTSQDSLSRSKSFPKCSPGIDKSQAFPADLPISREQFGVVFDLLSLEKKYKTSLCAGIFIL